MPQRDPDETVLERDVTGENTSEEATRPRTRSLRSWRSGRSKSRSRPSSRAASLNRIYSAGFHDDHGVYIDTDDFAPDESGVKQFSADVGDEDNEKSKQQDGEEGPLEEVESHEPESHADGNGIDRAAENGQLEKAPSLRRQATAKSTKSQRDRDPNMVSWDGPDDPENPKNWKMSRKWIATVVVSSFVRVRSEKRMT